MHTYEVESVEGVGYLVFERLSNNQVRRIGDVFLNLKQARDFVAPSGKHQLTLVGKSPYEEMINSDESPLV